MKSDPEEQHHAANSTKLTYGIQPTQTQTGTAHADTNRSKQTATRKDSIQPANLQGARV